TKVSWSHFDLNHAKPIRDISYLILIDSYSKWPKIVHVMSATTGIIINNLRVVFMICRKLLCSQRSPLLYLRTFFQDFNTSYSHFPPIFSGLDMQLVDNVKRQLLVLQEEDIAEEIPNSLQLRYQMTSHVGIQISVRYRKNLHSRHTVLNLNLI
ncbi:unnamed protein product, partial [Hymenolepis diminuta]